MLRLFSVLLAIAALSGCASTQAPARLTVEAMEAARLADLLTHTAQVQPDRVRAAGAEMAALERALTQAGAQPPSSADRPLAPMARAGAPDLTGAHSLMSAVHLASYREYANLLAGWSSLQAASPEALGALEPRISEVDLGESGVFLRLKAGPLDSPAQARALCARLEAAGQWCAAADYTGARLVPSAD